jgi:hypothetical protein
MALNRLNSQLHDITVNLLARGQHDLLYGEIGAQWVLADKNGVVSAQIIDLVRLSMVSIFPVLADEGLHCVILCEPWQKHFNRQMPTTIDGCKMCLRGKGIGIYHSTERNLLLDAWWLIRETVVMGTFRSMIDKFERQNSAQLVNPDIAQRLRARGQMLN